MSRQLFEKQAYEASKLESQLREQEIQDVNAILNKTNQKKQDAISQAQQVCMNLAYEDGS